MSRDSTSADLDAPLSGHSSGAFPSWPFAWNPDDAMEELKAAIHGGCWTVRSPHIVLPSERFEQAWAAYCGATHALLVPSGSSALELALLALDVGPGDEVIVPALGWYATTAAVIRTGAKPIFADVDPKTSCLSAPAVEECLTAKTATVVVVHLHGSVADMKALLQLTAQRKIPLIEDAAQAHGASYYGRMVGSLGTIGCFSFNQEKLLSAGEGGAVVTSDDQLADRLYAIRTDGYRRPIPPAEPGEPAGDVLGRNLCVSEFVAALLLSQFKGLELQEAIRQRNAAELTQALKNQSLAWPLESSTGTTRQVHYEYGFFLDRNLMRGSHSLTEIAMILSQRAGFPIHTSDGHPWNSANMLRLPAPDKFSMAKDLHAGLLLFHHRMLLTDRVVHALPQALSQLSMLSASSAH